MRNWIKFAVVIFVFTAPARALAEVNNPLDIFQKANTAYREGDFTRAANLYESLVQQGSKNAVVFYNLGNTYFKRGQLGQAILYYEKAKRLAPRDKDAVANLEYANGLLEYRIEDKRNWYWKMLETLLDSFTRQEIAIIGLSLGLVFWLTGAIFLFIRPNESWGWKRRTLFALVLICLSMWTLKAFNETASQEAVVLKNQASMRYGPSYKDRVAFRLAEGMKVRVKKKSGEWSRVILANGETGWMLQEEIGII